MNGEEDKYDIDARIDRLLGAIELQQLESNKLEKKISELMTLVKVHEYDMQHFHRIMRASFNEYLRGYGDQQP